MILRLFVLCCGLILAGCSSKEVPPSPSMRTDYLPSGASQMGAYGTGGQPMTRFSGGPGNYGARPINKSE